MFLVYFFDVYRSLTGNCQHECCQHLQMLFRVFVDNMRCQQCCAGVNQVQYLNVNASVFPELFMLFGLEVGYEFCWQQFPVEISTGVILVQ
jgi:hypothetical protein